MIHVSHKEKAVIGISFLVAIVACYALQLSDYYFHADTSFIHHTFLHIIVPVVMLGCGLYQLGCTFANASGK